MGYSPRLTVSAEGGYNGLVEETSPKIAGSYTNTFGDSFGLALAASWFDRDFGSLVFRSGHSAEGVVLRPVGGHQLGLLAPDRAGTGEHTGLLDGPWRLALRLWQLQRRGALFPEGA